MAYKYFIFSVLDAVNFALEVLENIRNGLDNQNIDELLREAERILIEIKSRDFSYEKDSSIEELNDAEECKKHSVIDIPRMHAFFIVGKHQLGQYPLSRHRN